MAAPKGNQFWKARSSHGRNPIFTDSDQLWTACEEYFEWVYDNPLESAIVYQGELKEDALPKMRAMTISGMCLFLDIDQSTWENYRDRKDFFRVTKKAEQIIYNQKFAGAAADMLNPNIIARDLGLADKKEHSGDPDKPLIVLASEMPAAEATELYKKLLDD
jgi:hypothetical protein